MASNTLPWPIRDQISSLREVWSAQDGVALFPESDDRPRPDGLDDHWVVAPEPAHLRADAASCSPNLEEPIRFRWRSVCTLLKVTFRDECCGLGRRMPDPVWRCGGLYSMPLTVIDPIATLSCSGALLVGAGLSAYLLGVAVRWSGVGLSALVRQRSVRGIERPVAQKIQTLFIDDLDSSAAEGTVRFGLDGAEYEIDLNEEHARALRDALARYVGAARRASGSARRPARTSRRAPAGAPGATEVREWARAQGIEVKGRGRVPAELVVRFKAATTGQ